MKVDLQKMEHGNTHTMSESNRDVRSQNVKNGMAQPGLPETKWK